MCGRVIFFIIKKSLLSHIFCFAPPAQNVRKGHFFYYKEIPVVAHFLLRPSRTKCAEGSFFFAIPPFLHPGLRFRGDADTIVLELNCESTISWEAAKRAYNG